MGPPPGTFERVYAAIKQRLRDGLYKPGRRLQPAVLSDELNASVTPIRDALHRLTGERLVDASRQDGFRVPAMTEIMLRHLYGWHLDLLLLAAAKHRALEDADPMMNDGADCSLIHERRNALFLALARSTGNPEHVAALEGSMARLEPMQRLEGVFLDGTEAEMIQIVEALAANDRRALRRSLVLYHRRRDRIVPDLLAVLLQT